MEKICKNCAHWCICKTWATENGVCAMHDDRKSEGEWVLIGNGNGRAIHWKCSVCGYETLDASNGDTNFCPNCGADMRGGE